MNHHINVMIMRIMRMVMMRIIPIIVIPVIEATLSHGQEGTT